MERTIKFQEAGNKALLQRIPVMPVSPEPVSAPRPAVARHLRAAKRRSDTRLPDLWRFPPYPRTFPLRDADGVAGWPAMAKSADQIISNTS